MTEPLDMNGWTATPPSLTRQNQYDSDISATMFLSVKSGSRVGTLAAAGVFPSPRAPWQTAHFSA